MNLHTSLRALRATLLFTLGAAPGCVGDGGDKDSGDTDTSPTAACVGSTPILDGAGAPTGYERCEDGTIHRVSAVATSAAIDLPSCRGDEAWLDCTTDADCTGGPNGKCYHEDSPMIGGKVAAPDTAETYDACFCTYSCATDADCGDGKVCVPGGIVTKDFAHATCEPAECSTDADCASGECGLSSYNDGCSYDTNLTCREATDSCRTDAECTDSTCASTSGDDAYACRTMDCAIGRPLLVEGQARVAAQADRGDWALSLSAEVEALDEDLRLALGRWWRDIAALEHASVGSFARFTLQLLALGAPPELLADTQRAAADEVEHARLTYGLASLYLGEAVGPGPLSLRELSLETSPSAVLVALIEEACVGETLGAAEARHAASLVEDEGLKRILTRITEDEERHAALAWRTLRWMVERDPSLQGLAAQTFAQVAARVRGAAPVRTPDAGAHGVLGTEERVRVHLAALTQVVLPCCAFLESKTVST